MSKPFVLITPSTRGLSLALTRHYLTTTNLPVYATHRSLSASEVHKNILSPVAGVDPHRLRLLHLDLTNESTIRRSAEQLSGSLDSQSYLHTAFLTGGVLHPERQPGDIDVDRVSESFNVNVISHLLLIKHFSDFLPKRRPEDGSLSKWVHVSARVGSISDNHLGGWYSYRSSKAALNQVIKTFDLDLQNHKHAAFCVGVHPGTVKTDLSKEFWNSVPKEQLFEPEDAATRVVGVIDSLKEDQRGRVWDYAGKLVPW